MKPINKQASKCQMELREDHRTHHPPSDRERNTRRFWKRQASKALRHSFDASTAEAAHWDDFYAIPAARMYDQ